MQVAAIFKTCPVWSPSQADSLQSHTIILREETHTYADLISLLKGQFKKKKIKLLGFGPFPFLAAQPSVLSCTDEVPQSTKQKNNLCLPLLARAGSVRVSFGLSSAWGGLDLKTVNYHWWVECEWPDDDGLYIFLTEKGMIWESVLWWDMWGNVAALVRGV